jgi:chromosome segregation ATPase
MRLFNQKNLALRWDMDGRIYECEPWGSLEIDGSLLAPIRSRGLPLDTMPVAPEVKAHQRVAEAQADIADKERAETDAKLVLLSNEVAGLRRRVEEQASELASARGHGSKVEALLSASKGEAAALRAELAAAEALLASQAGNESEEAKALTQRIVELTATELAARDELNAARRELAAQRELAAGKGAELTSLSAVHANALNDKKALEELLDETARSAKEALARAETAEKALAQLREKRKGAQPDQRA